MSKAQKNIEDIVNAIKRMMPVSSLNVTNAPTTPSTNQSATNSSQPTITPCNYYTCKYKCSRCGFGSDRRSTMDDHINKKKRCQAVVADVKPIITVPVIQAPTEIHNSTPTKAIDEARKRTSIPSAVRMAAWNKWNGRTSGVGPCCCCGEEITQQDFECGHVIPASKGGNNGVDNLRPLCRNCNRSMGDDHMDKFMEVYFPGRICGSTT